MQYCLSFMGESLMKKSKGIAFLLFAILLQLCSTGMELLILAIGVAGLVIAIIDDTKNNN